MMSEVQQEQLIEPEILVEGATIKVLKPYSETNWGPRTSLPPGIEGKITATKSISDNVSEATVMFRSMYSQFPHGVNLSASVLKGGRFFEIV
jgi:hypothetical protein